MLQDIASVAFEFRKAQTPLRRELASDPAILRFTCDRVPRFVPPNRPAALAVRLPSILQQQSPLLRGSGL